MLRFEIDKKKIMEQGGGSVTTFCKRNDIDHKALYNILQSQRKRFEDGSRQQAVAEQLIALGVAEWRETTDTIIA